MIVDVRKVQRELEGRFAAEQSGTDEVALKLYRESPQLASDYLTGYSVERGDATVKRWRQLGESLIVKYLDGNVRNEAGKVTHPGYPKSWYRRIAEDTGDHFRVIENEDDGS